MKKNLPIVTGIRFLAAFYVFIFHIDLRLPLDFLPNIILDVISQGAVGVNVFFVLSGFILYYGYHSKKINITEFILKRLAKIYPTYLVGLIIFLIVTLIMSIKTEYFFEVIMMNLLMVQSYLPHFAQSWYGGGSWSISTEFFFYFCFPFILKFISDISKNKTLTLIVFFYFISFTFGILTNFNILKFSFSYAFPPARISEFIIGVLTAHLVFKHKIKINIYFSIIIIFICALLFYSKLRFLYGYVIQNIIVIPLMIIILSNSIESKNNILGFLGNKVFEYLGKVSYSFYIIQLPIMLFLDNENYLEKTNSLLYFSVALIINLVSAILLYELIENPLHKILGKKIKLAFSK